MDTFITIFSLLLAIIIIIGIPFALSYGIYQLTKLLNLHSYFQVLTIAPILAVGFLIYTALYPSKAFYKDDFKEVTNMAFPDDGKILYNDATFPDHFGDYSSISLIEVNANFYTQLANHLKNSGFKTGDQVVRSVDFYELYEQVGTENIQQEFALDKPGGFAYYVGFMIDGKTIIVQRISW